MSNMRPVATISIVIMLILSCLLVVLFYRMSKMVSQIYPADLGLAYIDVSSYPQEMQRSYKIFASKCSRCHTLARPINSDFSAEKWQKYVYRMMNKSGSGLTKEISDEIIRFLIYDHQVRKK